MIGKITNIIQFFLCCVELLGCKLRRLTTACDTGSVSALPSIGETSSGSVFGLCMFTFSQDFFNDMAGPSNCTIQDFQLSILPLDTVSSWSILSNLNISAVYNSFSEVHRVVNARPATLWLCSSVIICLEAGSSDKVCDSLCILKALWQITIYKTSLLWIHNKTCVDNWLLITARLLQLINAANRTHLTAYLRRSISFVVAATNHRLSSVFLTFVIVAHTTESRPLITLL